MAEKSGNTAAWIKPFEGRSPDARYLAFFDLFNRQRFFEGHDVLEALWLKERTGPSGNFYKALIQLTGAFVHLQRTGLIAVGTCGGEFGQVPARACRASRRLCVQPGQQMEEKNPILPELPNRASSGAFA